MALNRSLKNRRPILPRSAKNKGAAFQKKIAKIIAQLLELEPSEMGYGDDCLIKPKRMGEKGVDIHIDKSVRKRFPIASECKNSVGASVPATIKQVLPYVSDGYKYWMCFMKLKQHRKPVVIMELDLFEKIMESAKPIEEKTWK